MVILRHLPWKLCIVWIGNRMTPEFHRDYVISHENKDPNYMNQSGCHGNVMRAFQCCAHVLCSSQEIRGILNRTKTMVGCFTSDLACCFFE